MDDLSPNSPPQSPPSQPWFWFETDVVFGPIKIMGPRKWRDEPNCIMASNDLNHL